MTKNGFEIRADVLELAKDYMDKQTALNVEMWEQLTKTNPIIDAKEMQESFEKVYKMYSTDELMAKAQEFYAFVENNVKSK